MVIKANRETVGLVVAATAMTLALAYAVRSRPAPSPVVAVDTQRDWTGHLADVAPATVDAPVPFKSADLVVPSSQLALPPLPAKPRRVCDDAACGKVPVPPVRRVAARPEPVVKAQPVSETGLLTTLNPLNHVPSLSTMGKPFSYAGDVMAGWFKRF